MAGWPTRAAYIKAVLGQAADPGVVHGDGSGRNKERIKDRGVLSHYVHQSRQVAVADPLDQGIEFLSQLYLGYG